MPGIKRIVFFITFSLLLLSAFTGVKEVAQNHSHKEKTGTYLSHQVHALAFLQPESVHTPGISHKTNDYAITKWFRSFLQVAAKTGSRKTLTAFPFQSSIHFEKISLLLFPFHFFW